MISKVLKVVGINLLVFVGLLLVLEAGGQIVALVRPSYDVLFMQPDRAVGWKQVPDLRFTWTGYDWYAAEFSPSQQINPFGFRDRERQYVPSPGTTRVAVLGDSFVEAMQVPLAGTATQLLERRLNETGERGGGRSGKWEVLNFGVSNHGVGQYLLMWEEYASKFRPNYVAVFVAKFHMRRTVSKYEYRAFTATREDRLWVRPTFRLENGQLVREPARDYEGFLKAQEELLDSEFAGSRIRKKPPQFLTLHYARILRDEFGKLVNRKRQDPNKTPRVVSDAEREMIALNLRILEELGLSVSAAGARMVIVDASQYFEDDPEVSRQLSALCASGGFGYVPVYEKLMQANANGIATRWKNDTHFNESGNEILASALYDWIERDAAPRTAR